MLINKYINQLLSLVKYIHYKGFGLININPSTVYISSSDNVTVADYSFSASVGCNDRVKNIPEHFENLPPEYYKTGSYIASQADIWSIGLLTFTLLTGNHPFLGNTPSYDHTEYSLRNALSQPVRVPSYINTMPSNFIQRLLELEPTRRFSIDQCQSHAWLAKISRRITKMNSFNALNTLNDNNRTFRTNGLSILANKTSPVRYNSQKLPNYRSFTDFRNPSEFDF